MTWTAAPHPGSPGLEPVGIDRMGFYTPPFCLPLDHLAAWRNTDPEKFRTGLGQITMGVIPPDEDIITMGAAAVEDMEGVEPETLDWLVVATESSVDQSRCAALYIHGLLGLPPTVRTIEMKQACYAGMAALDFATAWVRTHPGRTVLVVTSDVSRYGLGSRGESSQGAAAVAFLVSEQPRMLALHTAVGVHSQDALDFWRPNYCAEALVDGPWSCQVYLDSLLATYKAYMAHGGVALGQMGGLCAHAPFPRLAEKALQTLASSCGMAPEPGMIQASLVYGRETGNSYTASLFLGILSHLAHQSCTDYTDIGLYSYGSGAIGQFTSARIRQGAARYLNTPAHKAMLEGRTVLDRARYEFCWTFDLPRDGGRFATPVWTTNRWRLAGIDQHRRLYEDRGASVRTALPCSFLSAPKAAAN